MKTILLISLSIIIFYSATAGQNNKFLIAQKKFDRVKSAYKNKNSLIDSLFLEKKLIRNNYKILLKVFKEEGLLKVYVTTILDSNFKLLKQYSLTNLSGELGPKREEGDGQIPEGIYFIDRFNPKSNFHLSLGINYPNEYDKIYANKTSPGSDIFIHGGWHTIGCMPIGDDAIEEVYIFAIEAKANGQKHIPVHIFPKEFTDDNYNKLMKKYIGKEDILGIYKQLYKVR